jgi:broad-specificity NMP kinase
MKSNKKLPLFIITGASGIGKSTLSKVLFDNEERYIVLESDLLWSDYYDTPEDDYENYRKLWLRICSSISQIGMPVVLCGCAVPAQFEIHSERQAFSEIHYIAVVSDEETLVSRMKGRNIQDENWIKSSVDFNNWLINNADTTSPKLYLLDTTKMTAEEAASIADKWILERIR